MSKTKNHLALLVLLAFVVFAMALLSGKLNSYFPEQQVRHPTSFTTPPAASQPPAP